MATKRLATTELNHDNWNEDTPSEEAGLFQVATNEELSRRVVKKAKRRLGEGGSPSSSAFSGFSGFGTPSASKPSFDFLKPAAPPQSEKNAVESNGGVPLSSKASSANATPPPTSIHISPFVLHNTPTGTASPFSASGTQIAGTLKLTANSQRSDYLKQLRALNESVVAWIKQHVDKNPFCVLTPIFHDYGKYVQELEQKYPEADKTRTRPVAFEQGTAAAATFAVPTTKSPAASKMLFTSFKLNPSTDSRARLESSEVESQGSTDEVDEYEPPKNEVNEVKEDDALYSKRCKLFYKKDAVYIDKGVGTLYLKSVNSKTQLLVRAETNLGNILLNILLTQSLPVQRMGKNNVSLVCIPNPPLDLKNTPETPEPTTFLVRVKDGAAADELLEKLNEFKV